MSTTKTRRARRRNIKAEPNYIVSRIKRLLYSLLIIASIMGIAGTYYWRETIIQLSRAVWETAGIQLLLFSIWLITIISSIKFLSLNRVYRRWRVIISSFILLTAISLIPSVASTAPGLSTLDTNLGKLLTGDTVIQGAARIAILVCIALIIVYPKIALKSSIIAVKKAKIIVLATARITLAVALQIVRSCVSIMRRNIGMTGISKPAEQNDKELNVVIAQEPNYSDSEFTTPPTLPDSSKGVPTTKITPSSRSSEEILSSIDPFTGVPLVSWKLPPLKLLNTEQEKEIDNSAHKQIAQSIESTLADYGVEGSVTEVRPGPTVTLYGVRPGWNRKFKETKSKNALGKTISSKEEVGKTRVKVDRIAALDKDLALQLKASNVRIDAPIPGTDLVGIEVPNPSPTTVFLRNQLSSKTFTQAVKTNGLPFALGKGSGGDVRIGDLTKMPHLLVAGATGSGKSVFVNSFITSLLTAKTPQEIRFIMIDPKRVELTVYNGIPHLITPVIVDTHQAVNALRWLLEQMDTRLEQLASASARDIRSFNEKQASQDKMPYLVLIIDELADLMLTAGKSIEQRLVRLAQMGRATGIHLLVATQRPSVDVVTGLIKANFPARISFNVTSLIDSRTILDTGGAEKLLGKGDMLYLPQDAAKPTRIQGSFLSEIEAEDVVQYWKTQSKGYVPPTLPDSGEADEIISQDGWTSNNGPGAGSGEITQKARELAEIYGGKISTSLLQRRLGIGYPRAARLKDQLIEEGLASANIPNAPAETRGRGTRRS
ncbi:MAG: DNA translocase FtsK [Chloroflexota bacterium]|nr:DNA translocase FtsK [Chloroflexota bacterium]